MIELALRPMIAAVPVVAQYAAAVYPLRLPQDASYPNIILTRISGVHHTSLSGPSQLCRARIQVDFRANDYDVAKLLANGVRLAIAGFKGPVGGFTVYGIHLDGDEETYEAPYAANDVPTFRIQHDYAVWYLE